jgi:hypothetical protein
MADNLDADSRSCHGLASYSTEVTESGAKARLRNARGLTIAAGAPKGMSMEGNIEPSVRHAPSQRITAAGSHWPRKHGDLALAGPTSSRPIRARRGI